MKLMGWIKYAIWRIRNRGSMTTIVVDESTAFSGLPVIEVEDEHPAAIAAERAIREAAFEREFRRGLQREEYRYINGEYPPE